MSETNARGTILVVNADPSITRGITSAIERQTRFRCIAFDCSQEALDRARENNLELIVADVEMPNITGISLVRILRDEGLGTPVLLVTKDSGLNREYDLLARQIPWCRMHYHESTPAHEIVEAVEALIADSWLESSTFALVQGQAKLCKVVEAIQARLLAPDEIDRKIETAMSIAAGDTVATTPELTRAARHLDRAVQQVSVQHFLRVFWKSPLFHLVVWPLILTLSATLANHEIGFRDHTRQIENVHHDLTRMTEAQESIRSDISDIRQAVRR